MKFSNDLKDLCKTLPSSKEVHINENGEWLFGGVNKEFGKHKTFTCKEVVSEETKLADPVKEEVKESKKK